MPTTFSEGARVKVTLYGKEFTGVVTHVGNSIIWVKLDGAKRSRWVHPESLTLVA